MIQFNLLLREKNKNLNRRNRNILSSNNGRNKDNPKTWRQNEEISFQHGCKFLSTSCLLYHIAFRLLSQRHPIILLIHPSASLVTRYKATSILLYDSSLELTAANCHMLKPNPLPISTARLPPNLDQVWSKGTGCPGGDLGRGALPMAQRKDSCTACSSVDRAYWSHTSFQNQVWV